MVMNADQRRNVVIIATVIALIIAAFLFRWWMHWRDRHSASELDKSREPSPRVVSRAFPAAGASFDGERMERK
jgi:hypothetical protein